MKEEPKDQSSEVQDGEGVRATVVESLTDMSHAEAEGSQIAAIYAEATIAATLSSIQSYVIADAAPTEESQE